MALPQQHFVLRRRDHVAAPVTTLLDFDRIVALVDIGSHRVSRPAVLLSGIDTDPPIVLVTVALVPFVIVSSIVAVPVVVARKPIVGPFEWRGSIVGPLVGTWPPSRLVVVLVVVVLMVDRDGMEWLSRSDRGSPHHQDHRPSARVDSSTPVQIERSDSTRSSSSYYYYYS